MIRAKYQIATPSVGAMLREEKTTKTKLGLEAARFTDEGRLVPDEMIVELARAWLAKHNGAFVFDGFPRTIAQATALDQLLEQRGTPLEIALSLDVDFETIRGRVSRRKVCEGCGRVLSVGWHVDSPDSACPDCGGKLAQRSDDTPEALKQRMIDYHEKSESLISFYRDRGILTRIDGAQAPEIVFADVVRISENA